MNVPNPFELFGLPVKFAIDEKALKEKYLEILNKVHPDRFISASEAEKRVAQQWATIINDAYKKLSDPLERGLLICALKGKPVDKDRSTLLDEDFLFQQLERREAIADAKEAEDEKTLKSLKLEIQNELGELTASLQNDLDQTANLDAAQVSLQKIMFLNRQLQDFE